MGEEDFFSYFPEIAGLDMYVKGIAIQHSFLKRNLRKVLANKTPLVFVRKNESNKTYLMLLPKNLSKIKQNAIMKQP